MTLTQQAKPTEEAIATKLLQLQSDIKQLNPDYELRSIPTFNRRWRKTVLHSYSVWRKGMPGVKKFVLSDYGSAQQDLERRNRALDAVADWIKERREAVPIRYDVVRYLGEVISAELRQGDVIQTLYSELAPMVVMTKPIRTGNMVEFEAVREDSPPFTCSFNWQWRFELLDRQNIKAA
jgi:hypothetical protein